MPLFLLWFGIGETSEVLLIAFAAFFPVYLNPSSGLRAIDVRWLEVAQLFGYRGWRLVRHVLLPAVLPSYVTGLRSGLGLGWMFVGRRGADGGQPRPRIFAVDGQTTSRPELILGALLLFAILGKLSDGLLERLARRSPFERARPLEALPRAQRRAATVGRCPEGSAGVRSEEARPHSPAAKSRRCCSRKDRPRDRSRPEAEA